MAPSIHQLHFLIVPLMSQSHLIPMTDFAKLVAQRGAAVTIVTTPLNADRYSPIVDRAARAGLRIRLEPLRFPCREAGLPDGCENMDTLTSPDMISLFFEASLMLKEPLERLVGELRPRPSCIVTSNALPWTAEVADKFSIPRYIFNAISCFTLLVSHKISLAMEERSAETGSIVVPDVPHRIEFKMNQLPKTIEKKSSKVDGLMEKMKEARLSAQGILVNSFEEMEEGYVEEYKKVARKTWCIGPVSLCNKDKSDKFDRGNKASIDEHYCLKWLDSKKPNSVIYICFGSLCHIPPSQLKEIGMGLEASKRPFIWIIRQADYTAEVQKWLEEEEFEKRNKDQGLIIRGWAPQVLILAHTAVAGFLTHCGWNSTLEGICAGVPMITWPMFAEQFYNEKFITQVLKTGLKIGVEVGMQWGEEDKVDQVLVKKEQLKKAVDLLMDEGEEGEERRRRAKEVAEKAKRAVEEGGSSHSNLTLLTQDVINQVNHKVSTPATQLSVACGFGVDGDQYSLRPQLA